MSFETDLIERYLPKRREATAAVDGRMPAPADDMALFCAATAAVVRLDERVRAASPVIRAGWTARALLHEAAASARLDEAFAEVHDLVLMDHDALDRLVDQGAQQAYQTLNLLRAVGRRHPRQLFTPRRLLAAARVRLRGRADDAGYPEWLESRRAAPQEIRTALERALAPAALAELRARPVLVAAGEFLTLWHGSGASEAIGGAAGRALTGAWLRRAGLIDQTSFLPAVGFLGHAADYRPDQKQRWLASFHEASLRGAEWGLAMLSGLLRAERRLRDGARPERASSRLPALIDLILISPAVSAGGVAKALKITQISARRLLDHLQDRNLIWEITGRGSFRLFSEK